MGKRRRSPAACLLLVLCLAGWRAVLAETAAKDGARPFWRPLVEDHWKHVVLVLGASIANAEIDRQAGPRGSPLLFREPPGLDTGIRDRFRRGSGDTGPHGFIEHHVTPITRSIAAAAIVACDGSRWRDDVNDFLGLWEAQRFNLAATGIVKNVFGRTRPRLEFAAADGATSAEIARLGRSDSNHQSFYSYQASSAFTTLAYADLVLSRRLFAHPAARLWSHVGLYSLGAYVAWSRVLQDGHYFSDVLAGSIAGTFVGRSFYSFNRPDGLDHRLSWDPLPGRRLTISPPVPVPGGAVMRASIAL
jgi:membrane-associated phospholipid phosphatase